MAQKIELGHILIALIILGGLWYAYTTGLIPEYKPEEEGLPQIIIREKETITKTKTVETSEVGKLPIESLKVKAKNKFTMADIEDVQIEFWEVGGDPSDPNQAPLDEVTTDSSGVGTTTSMIIQTDTDYDIWFNGSSTYYDELIPEWVINYNPETGKGFLLVDEKSWYPAVDFGSFVDVADPPESSSAINESTTEDTIYYDESDGTGSAWWKLDLGNADANSEIHDMVMCFRDSDGDMEGDELTGFTASFVSGSTKITIPGSLLGYWRDGMGSGAKRCVSIATSLGSAEKARWQFDITVDEDNLEAGEEFEISFDDLGDFSKRQYPSSNVKVVAETLTIAQQD